MKTTFDFTKMEVIKVNYSSPFLIKSRCKKCHSLPSIYYYIHNRYLALNCRRSPRKVKRMCANYYLLVAPANISDIGDLVFTPLFKGCYPTLQRTRGHKNNTNMTEYLMCDCGETSWAFSDKAIRNRPEIANRKGRHLYPQKFEF